MVESTIVWILICTFISNSAYALVAPFLPLEFETKGISDHYIGLIFAIYSVAVVLISPVIGMVVSKLGTTNLISGGIAIMGMSFVCFGFVEYLEKQIYILALGFILRFIQGASSAFVQTTCYSIATNDFPEKKEMIVGWVEAMTGLGLIVGPIIGSTLYSLFGYSYTFFIYGAFLVLLAVMIKCNFPQRPDLSEIREELMRQLIDSREYEI